MRYTSCSAAAFVLALVSSAAQTGGVEIIQLNRALDCVYRPPGLPITSPDGEDVVYRSVRTTVNDGPAFLARAKGGEGTPLGWILDAGFTQDGRGLVIETEPGTGGTQALLRLPLEAPDAPRVLDSFPPGRGILPNVGLPVALAANKERVVYAADRDADELFELYSVLLDGGGAPVKLSAPLPAGESVQRFEFSSDGGRVVYSTGWDPRRPSQATALFVVPTDGGTPAVPLESQGTIASWFLTRTERVIFVSDRDEEGHFELFSIPLDGGTAPVKLSGVLPPDDGVIDFFDPSPGASRVVYVVGTSSPLQPNPKVEFFSAALEGGGSPVLLDSYAARASDPVTNSALAGERLLLVHGLSADPSERRIDSVPIDGSAPATRISAPATQLGDLQLSFDGERALYGAVQQTGGSPEIFSVPVDGSSPAVRLNPPLPPGSAALISDFTRIPVFFGTPAGALFLVSPLVPSGSLGESFDLYLAALDGSAPARKLASDVDRYFVPDPLPWSAFQEGPRVYFTRRGRLFSLELALGSTPGEFTPGSTSWTEAGSVGDFELSQDGTRTLYIAAEDEDGVNVPQLFSVVNAERTEHFQLPSHPLDSFETVRSTPDGRHALVAASRGTERFLYAVPTDGGDPVRLTPPDQSVVGTQAISPDGARVAYFAATSGRVEAFCASMDGSAPPTHLSAALPVAASSEVVVFSADGSRVGFLSVARALYSAPSDGGQPAQHIVARFEVMGDFVLSPDGARVFFRTDPLNARRGELFTAPSDASAPALRLSSATGGDLFAMAISRDASRAFYLASQDLSGVVELYTVPTDGSAPSTKLNPPLSGGRDVHDFLLSPDDRWVVFRGDVLLDQRQELFRVPSDGSLPATRLSGALVPGGNVLEYGFSPDSSAVVFRADGTHDGVPALFSAPLRALHQPRLLAAFADSFQISADSGAVVYSAGGLFTVGLAGLGKAVPLAPNGAFDYQTGPDGKSVAYRRGVDLFFARAVPGAASSRSSPTRSSSR